MTYKEAQEYIDLAAKSGSVYGLDSIIRLTGKLGNPQDKLKIIHVCGTNGKGSTIAYISTILSESGYKVGRYISPTVVEYLERFQINGTNIDKESFAKLMSKAAQAVSQIVSEGFEKPTAFEIETAIAFMYFLEEKCDFAIIETGMGGEMDATNLINNTLCSVIASISMDHMGFLGNTIGEIAKNKAGIIKPGAKVISLKQKPEAMKVIEDKANKCGCQLKIASQDNVFDIKHGYLEQIFSYKSSKKQYKDLKTGLCGTCQLENAILAIETIEALREAGYSISDESVYKGLCNAKWVGRFTKIMDKPTFIVDGAHNEDAAAKLRETIDLYFTNIEKIYIMGVLADKEYNCIIDRVLTKDDIVITVTPDNNRALPAKELADILKSKVKRVTVADNIADAVGKSLDLATQDSVIIAFGSLYYLGDVIKAVDELKESV